MFVFGTTVSEPHKRRRGRQRYEAEDDDVQQVESSQDPDRRRQRRLPGKGAAAGRRRGEDGRVELAPRSRSRRPKRPRQPKTAAREERQKKTLRQLQEEEQALLKRLESTRARLELKMRLPGQPQALPVLASTSAEAALEVGLRGDEDGDEGGAAEGGKEAERVLPIFQLPTVGKHVPLVNKLPEEPSGEEEQLKLEEEEARRQAQQQLGLTDEEVQLFDSLVTGGASSPRPPFGSHCDEVGGAAAPKATAAPSAPAAPATSRQAQNRKPHKSKRTLRRRKAAGEGPDARHEGQQLQQRRLRKELHESIGNVQVLTSTVQQELSALQREFPLTSVKAQAFVKQLGLARLRAVFEGVDQRRLAAGFRRWARSAADEQLAQKRAQYLRLQSSGMLARVMARMQRRRVAAALRRWTSSFRFEKNNEEFVAMSRAAAQLQRLFRGHRGRARARRARQARELAEMSSAAAAMQRAFRGRRAKVRTDLLREKRVLHQAARRIQRNYRARAARVRARRRRADFREESRAALLVQTAWRRRQGQLAIHMLRRARREAAAEKSQAAQRERVAAQRQAAERELRRQERACVMLQRAFRFRRASSVVARKRQEVRVQRAKEEMVALRLQAVYRGHRGRLVYQLKHQARRALAEQDAEAVEKIQAVFRGKMGRRGAARREKEQLGELCAWARGWAEEFDDAAQDYVFRNLYTQEVRLEPPAEGYARRDKMLALLDGRVVEDPDVAAKKAREQHLVQCVECEAVAATRTCHECEDPMCDECFDSVHAKGKLASHAYAWFQEGGPQADASAALYASQASGAAGAAGDAEPQWVELFDEESGLAYFYDSASGNTSWEKPAELYDAEEAAAPVQEEPSEWQQFHDDGSGLDYWYNSVTGETKWADEADASAGGGEGGEGGDGDQGLDGAPEDVATEAEYAATEAEDAWEDAFDEASGMAYEYNASTGETRWK